MMGKKLTLLMVTFLFLMITSVAALVLAQGEASLSGGCTFQYTYCSNNGCSCSGGGFGADGEHVYHCVNPPYVRSIGTCCGCG